MRTLEKTLNGMAMWRRIEHLILGILLSVFGFFVCLVGLVSGFSVPS